MKQRMIKEFLWFFVALSLLLGTFFVVVYLSEIDKKRAILELNETLNIDLGSKAMIRDLTSIVSDLMTLSQNSTFKTLGDVPSLAERDQLAETFLTFSRNKGLYDQIRYLDGQGREVIRVNFNDGHPRSVSKDSLQDKSKRYYFTDAIRLEREEAFISPLDLNFEHGKVEVPHKPMIRFGTPVFDGEGHKRGIVLLNYFGARLIANFESAVANISDHAMILNSNGYWLRSPDRDLEWGFMLGHEHRFDARSPKSWERILKADTGQFYSSDGLVTFSTVYPLVKGLKSSTGASAAFEMSKGDVTGKKYFWKVVSLVPTEALDDTNNQIIQRILLVAGPLYVLLLLGAGRLAYTRNQWAMAKEALQQDQKVKALGNLAGGITHELNSLLLPITALTQMALKKLPQDNSERAKLEKVVEAADRASKVVEQVLTFSRMESPDRKDIEMASIVIDILKLIHIAAPSTIKIEEHLDKDVGIVCVDTDQIKAILMNLTDNALDAMDGQTGTLKISLLRAVIDKGLIGSGVQLKSGTYAKLSVSDTGCGINEEVLKRLFDPFYTTKDVGKGTGLGLSIVHGIVRQHGGAINVFSEVDTGTTFEIYLPLIKHNN